MPRGGLLVKFVVYSMEIWGSNLGPEVGTSHGSQSEGDQSEILPVHMCVCVCVCVCVCACVCVPVPVAARSKASVCGLSLAGIVGSNPAGVMDVCLL